MSSVTSDKLVPFGQIFVLDNIFGTLTVKEWGYVLSLSHRFFCLDVNTASPLHCFCVSEIVPSYFIQQDKCKFFGVN